MALNKFIPYTEEDSKLIIERYQAGESVDVIAASINRTPRSVIAKLSREGVYQAKHKNIPRATKASMVEDIAKHLLISAKDIETIEKATHEHLVALHQAVVTNLS